MREAIQKADVLIEAMGWIRRFRDRVTVIKLGGSVMGIPMPCCRFGSILFSWKPWECDRSSSTEVERPFPRNEAAGITPRFIQGRRYTDAATRDIVERVLAGQVNRHITDEIERLGGRRSASISIRPTSSSENV